MNATQTRILLDELLSDVPADASLLILIQEALENNPNKVGIAINFTVLKDGVGEFFAHKQFVFGRERGYIIKRGDVEIDITRVADEKTKQADTYCMDTHLQMARGMLLPGELQRAGGLYLKIGEYTFAIGVSGHDQWWDLRIAQNVLSIVLAQFQPLDLPFRVPQEA